jgi:hypothetical protein
VLRIDGEPPHYHDVQVKTVRRTSYVFMRKDKFRLSPNLLLALVVLPEHREPEMCLIPSSASRQSIGARGRDRAIPGSPDRSGAVPLRRYAS